MRVKDAESDVGTALGVQLTANMISSVKRRQQLVFFCRDWKVRFFRESARNFTRNLVLAN